MNGLLSPDDMMMAGPQGAYSGPRTAGDVLYGAGATASMFAPGSGIVDIAGMSPDIYNPGEYNPSLYQNILAGNYVDALLQGLGGAGDLVMAAGAGVPPLIPVGAAMKAPRAARLASRAEDVSGTFLAQQPKKRPKIRQMPQAEQDLYEAAAAFQLPREVGEGLLLPRRAYEFGARTADVGSQGLLVDPGFQNLQRDMPDLSGTVVRDLDTLAKSPVVDLQKLIGRTALLVPGDMTMAGKEITHVQGVKLKNPVRMQGGKDFPAEELSRELGIVWASDIPIISRYVNAAKRNPGLVGVYSAMGGRGGDFSHHVADVLVDMTKQAEWLPKSEIEKFNKEVRATKADGTKDGKKIVTYPLKDFPGITSPDVEDYMYSPGKGASRKAIADVMQKGSFRDVGFPDVTAVRMVVSDPAMSSRVNDPSDLVAPTGARIFEFDPNLRITGGEGNAPKFHKTYRQGIGGSDLGGLLTPVPRNLMFPTRFDPKRIEGAGANQIRRAGEVGVVLEDIVPEIADDVSVFQDYFNRGLLGKGM